MERSPTMAMAVLASTVAGCADNNRFIRVETTPVKVLTDLEFTLDEFSKKCESVLSTDGAEDCSCKRDNVKQEASCWFKLVQKGPVKKEEIIAFGNTNFFNHRLKGAYLSTIKDEEPVSVRNDTYIYEIHENGDQCVLDTFGTRSAVEDGFLGSSLEKTGERAVEVVDIAYCDIARKMIEKYVAQVLERAGKASCQ